MTKNQKIWFAVFLAMFLVPEVLWDPVSNFYYELLQSGSSGGTHPIRQNFLTNSDNAGILKIIITTQFLGLLLAFGILLTSKFSKKIVKIIIATLMGILIFFVGFMVLFAFNFNPQIG